MEEKTSSSEEKPYVSRPAWQLWGARIGLVLFLLLVILQIVHIVQGF